MNINVETLVAQAEALGASFAVDGRRVRVSAPDPLPANLMAELKSRKAAVMSYLVLPDEFRATVRWARWLVEHQPEDRATIYFYEAPLRPVTLKISDVGRYVTRRLGSLSQLSSWEAVGSKDRRPGWRQERIGEICGGLKALKQALEPLGVEHEETEVTQ